MTYYRLPFLHDASERRGDVVEQCAHTGLASTPNGLATDAARPAGVRLGRPADHILYDWHANHLVGRDRQLLSWLARIRSVRISHAEVVHRHGGQVRGCFLLCTRHF